MSSRDESCIYIPIHTHTHTHTHICIYCAKISKVYMYVCISYVYNIYILMWEVLRSMELEGGAGGVSRSEGW